MTWNSPSDAGSGSNKVQQTTISVATTLGFSVGSFCIVAMASDNPGTITSDGVTNHHLSITDLSGNTYVKLAEYANGDTVEDGAIVSLWITQVTAAIGNGDTLTGTLASSRTAKALGIGQILAASGKTYRLATAAIGAAADASTAPSLSISGLTSGPYLYLYALAVEGPADVYTQDTDYTAFNAPGTTGGAAGGNMRLRFGRRVTTTGTGDTFAPTLGTARDWAGVYVALQEVVVGAVTIAGGGVIGSSGVRTRSGAAAIAGGGVLSATAASASNVTGATAIVGGGVLSSAGVRKRSGATAIAGQGALASAGVRTRFGADAIAGGGVVSSAGVRKRFGVAAIAGNGALSASAQHTVIGAGAIAGAGAVSSSGTRMRAGAASIAGGGIISSSGTFTSIGAAALQGQGAIVALGVLTRLGVAQISGAGQIVVDIPAERLSLPPKVLDGPLGTNGGTASSRRGAHLDTKRRKATVA